MKISPQQYALLREACLKAPLSIPFFTKPIKTAEALVRKGLARLVQSRMPCPMCNGTGRFNCFDVSVTDEGARAIEAGPPTPTKKCRHCKRLRPSEGCLQGLPCPHCKRI